MRSEPDRATCASRPIDHGRSVSLKTPAFRLFVLAPPLLTGSVVAGLTALVRYDAGPTIGYLLVTFLFDTVVAATLATASPTCRSLVRRTVGVWIGASAVWGYDVHSSVVTGAQWASIVVLLLTTVVAVATTVIGFERCGVAAPIPTALVVTLFLMWYACPIWVPAILANGRLLNIHPAFTLNGIVPNLGIWGEQPLGYQLTTLGQDAPYSLPKSIQPAVVAELAWAVLVAAAVIARQALLTMQQPAVHHVKLAAPER